MTDTDPNETSAGAGRHYGWVMVLVAFVLTGLCFGGVALVAVLLKPLAQEFGWQRGEVSMAYTVATTATALAGLVYGRLTDLYGVRVLLVVGAAMIAACMMLLSRIEALWQLYAIYALFGLLGFGAISVPMTTTVTNWFTVNRGLALGIATAGGAIGQGVVPYAASALMAGGGWRGAAFTLGIVYFLIALPLALFARDPPRGAVFAAAGPLPSAQQAAPLAPREALGWICAAVVFCCFCMSVPIIHVPALVSDLGFDAERAASVLTVIMLGGAAGRVVIGRIADRLGPLNAYILASFGQTALVFWFVKTPGLAGLYGLAAAFGFCFGGVMTGFLLTIRSLVPARIAGVGIATVVLFGWAGMGLGAYFGGLLFDRTGSYAISFGAAALSGVVNLTILSLLFARVRRPAAA